MHMTAHLGLLACFGGPYTPGTAHLIFPVRSKFVSLKPFRETKRDYLTEQDARGTLLHGAETVLAPISPDFQAWLIHPVRIHTGHEHPMSLISPMESQDKILWYVP